MRLLKRITGWLFEREAKRAVIGEAPPLPGDPASGEEMHARLIREATEQLAAGHAADAERVIAVALQQRHDDVEALLLQGLAQKQRNALEDAADSFLLAAHFQPDCAEAHYQLGLLAASQLGPVEAEQHYRRALRADPRHAGACLALGTVLIGRESLDEAADCFRRVIDIDPESARAHSNLGALMAARLDRFDEAAPHLEKASRLAPNDPDVISNWAMYLQSRGELAESIALCDRLVEADPAAHIPRLNRGLALLKLGEFSRGWTDYEARKETGWPYGTRKFSFPEWQGEPLAGRRILVHAEQGVGDQIMFASCIPDLLAAGGDCVVECASGLEALFRRSFPRAVIRGGKKDAPVDRLGKYGEFDYQVPVGSLPRHFRPNRAAFPGVYPYLREDPVRCEVWRARLRHEAAGPFVGISWRGGTTRTFGQTRSVPTLFLHPLLSRGFSWISLQHGTDDQEVRASGLRSFPGVTSDLDELAALMKALDLVISVDNTNVHLAGALGCPVWVLLPSSPEWRYGAVGDTMPWYPSAKLYRRGHSEGWEGLLARLALDLDVFLGRSRSNSSSA